MGGIGRRIRITGEGDHQALQQAVWEMVLSAWRMWGVPGEAGAAMREYLLESADPAEWRGQQGELSWSFSDFAGNCNTSMEAALHWLDLALSTDWRGLGYLVDQHGFELASEPMQPACSGQLVVLRGHLWYVDEDRLFRDGASLALEELDETERASASQARQGCMCPACAFVRPEPAIASAFARSLDESPSPEVLGGLCWYVGRMSSPPPELIAAMGRAVERDPAHSRPLLDAMEALGPRVSEPESLAMRLAWREGRGEFDRSEALAALRAEPPASGLAAEIVGRRLHAERDLFWPRLVEIVTPDEVDEETRHRVVLALVNLYLPRGPVPPQVFELFVREGARSSEPGVPGAASLARWAQGVFDPQNAK